MTISENYKRIKDSVGSISESLVGKSVNSVSGLGEVAAEIRKIEAEKTATVSVTLTTTVNKIPTSVSFYINDKFIQSFDITNLPATFEVKVTELGNFSCKGTPLSPIYSFVPTYKEITEFKHYDFPFIYDLVV